MIALSNESIKNLKKSALRNKLMQINKNLHSYEVSATDKIAIKNNLMQNKDQNELWKN